MSFLKAEINYFIAAIQLLTRLPVPSPPGFHPNWLERSAKYFPLIGVIVGALSALVLLVSAQLWSGMLPPLLAVAAGVVLTGAMHEDGLADFFDAMGATREARLRIMKDSRIGTYGVLALSIALALKVLALAAIWASNGAAALIEAHAGGRFAIVVVISVLPYAGDVSTAKVRPFASKIRGQGFLIAAIIGLAPLLLLPHMPALAGCLLGIAAAAFMAWGARYLIGGYTGDVLGAVEQSYEIGFLLGVAACA